MGGAMDIVAVQRSLRGNPHFEKERNFKLLKKCTLPLTVTALLNNSHRVLHDKKHNARMVLEKLRMVWIWRNAEQNSKAYGDHPI